MSDVDSDWVGLTAELMATRRTVLPKRLQAPGPTPAQELALLEAAATAPDHRQLQPWRLIRIPLEQRPRLADIFAAALLERDAQATAEQQAQAREKAFRAPYLLLLVLDDTKGDPTSASQVSLAERILSAGCALQNMLLMATAMGLGSALTSGKALQSQVLRQAFDLTPNEQALCFVSIGTAEKSKNSRLRPAPELFISTWCGAPSVSFFLENRPMNSSAISAISAIPVENINQISHIALPGHHAPGVGFEEPFEMLEACHERSLRMLWLLERVQTHLSQKGWDTEVAQAAADVIRYFDQAAPRHHEDEERHLFSRLLASAAHQHLHELVARLQQEHHDMKTVWAQVRPILWRVAHWGDDGQPNPSAHWQALGPQEMALLKQFGKLYDDHIPDEDNMIYPAAKHLLDPAALRAMSEDMMQRRGLPVGTSE